MISDRYLKVEGHSNIVRDLKTNAIINTDTQEYQNYISNKNRRLKEKQKLESIQNDVEYLKNSIEEIKQLLIGMKNES